MNIGISETYSFCLALVASVAAGLVGSFALLKKTVLAGDVMSHIALPGLGIALLLRINPLIGGAATLFAGAVLIWQLQKTTGLSTDAMIGVIFATSLAAGALITPNEDLIEALFGGFGKMTTVEFLFGMLAAFFVIGFTLAFRNKLILALFSEDLAATSSININRLNLYFLLIFSLTILLGLRFLGALLVGALLIIPPAIGRHLTHTLSAFLIVSSIASLASVAIGILISNVFQLPLGPSIISISAAIFFVSLFKRKI